MREIKFRFWTPDKRMLDDHDGWIEDTGINYALVCSKDYGYIAMQFTGIKDEKGKDIYEGDILQARYAPNYKLNAFEVKWNVGSASFVCYRKHENPKVQFEQLPLCPSNSMENLEVIGNVYEHPELMSGRHEA